MSCRLSFIIIGLLYFIQKCNSVYVGDSFSRMKMKILQMDKELVLNAIRNVQRVDHIKEYYKHFPSYDIGRLIYSMRSKFARMTRLYILSNNNMYNYDHNKLILNMNEIQKLAMEMVSLIEIVEDWEAKADKRPTKHPKGLLKQEKSKIPIENKTEDHKTNDRLRMGKFPGNTNSVHFRNKNIGKANKFRGVRDRNLMKPFTAPEEGVGFDSDVY